MSVFPCCWNRLCLWGMGTTNSFSISEKYPAVLGVGKVKAQITSWRGDNEELCCSAWLCPRLFSSWVKQCLRLGMRRGWLLLLDFLFAPALGTGHVMKAACLG